MNMTELHVPASCTHRTIGPPTLAQSTAIAADTVSLGTTPAILHRYLERDRARPYLQRFRSRVRGSSHSSFCCRGSPRTANRLPLSQPAITSSGSAPASTRSHSDGVNHLSHGGERAGINR